MGVSSVIRTLLFLLYYFQKIDCMYIYNFMFEVEEVAPEAREGGDSGI